MFVNYSEEMEEHWTVVIFTFVLGSKFTDKIFFKNLKSNFNCAGKQSSYTAKVRIVETFVKV